MPCSRCCMCDPQTDARPIDQRTDRPYRNLSEVHYAGKDGLAATFPVGSYWEVGPFVEGKDPEVVKVTGAPFSSGVNYSKQPEDADALGKPCRFIQTETVYSPHYRAPAPGRGRNGQPPHVLCALTPRMARKLGISDWAVMRGAACCDCAGYIPPCPNRVLSCNAGVIQVSIRAEAETLRETLRETERDLRRALEYGNAQRKCAESAERKLKAIKAVL